MTNEIVQYKLLTNQIMKHTPWHEPDRLLHPRRNFCSTLVGNDWVCFGGLTSGNRLTDQIIKVNLETMQWTEITPVFTLVDDPNPGPSAYAAMCSVI